MSPRAWMVGLSLLGLGVAVYLAVVHHTQGEVPLACTTSGVVNCEQVTSSAQSMVGPLPVADLGVIWFVVMLGLLAQERSTASAHLRLYELGWAACGLLVVLYLVYAELFLIGAICAWCTLVHLVTILLFLLALARFVGTQDAALPEDSVPDTSAPRRARAAANGARGATQRP